MNIVVPSGSPVEATRTTYIGGDVATSHTAHGASEYAGMREFEVVVAATAVDGTTPTLDVTLEGSITGTGSWYTIATVDQITTEGTKREFVSDVILPGYLRVVETIGGTDPEFTYSVALLVSQ